MASAVRVPTAVHEAVGSGRQLVLLLAEAPIVEGLFVVPGTVPGAEDARPGGSGGEAEARLTVWCRLDGLVPARTVPAEAIREAGVWSRDRVDAFLAEHPGAHLALVAPHRLPDAIDVTVPEAAPGQVVAVDAEVDRTTLETVLDRGTVRDRHGLLRTALGLRT